MNISLILVCIILETATQLSFKAGANSSSFKQTICEPIVWLGILLWAIEVALWMQVLKTTALTFAFPIMSLTYVITLIGSAIIFQEYISKRHAFGALLITAGVSLIGVNKI